MSKSFFCSVPESQLLKMPMMWISKFTKERSTEIHPYLESALQVPCILRRNQLFDKSNVVFESYMLPHKPCKSIKNYWEVNLQWQNRGIVGASIRCQVAILLNLLISHGVSAGSQQYMSARNINIQSGVHVHYVKMMFLMMWNRILT